jgi:hypothetical protein
MIVGLFLAASGCASAPRPIAMTCRPMGDVHVEGAPLSLRFELTNASSADHTVLGMNLPWVYRWALRFESSGYEEPLVIDDPGVYDDVFLAAGASDRGDVDVTQRLLDPSGHPIVDAPGTHRITARGRFDLEAGTPTASVETTSCETDVVIVPRTSPVGRAYAIVVQAAEAASTTMADYRLVSAAEESDGAWSFSFEHVYPSPPGGMFGVRVDRDGHAVVQPGE